VPLERVPVYEPELELDPYMRDQPGNRGRLKSGQLVHGFRAQGIAPPIQAEMDEIRAQFDIEFPGVADSLSLPTIELFCAAMARQRALNNYIMRFLFEGESRVTQKGMVLYGIEAVPVYIWAEVTRAEANAGKFAESLGLDLLGRVKALKDDAIRTTLAGRDHSLSNMAATGAALRELRSGRS